MQSKGCEEMIQTGDNINRNCGNCEIKYGQDEF